MKTKIVICIERNESTAAALVSDEFHRVWEVLEYLKDCLDSCNQYLTNKDIPNCIFANRFFEIENVERTRYPLVASTSLLPNSREYIEKNFSTYDISSKSVEEDAADRLGVTISDIVLLKSETFHTFSINFDTRTISIMNLFNIKTEYEYCEINGIDEMFFDPSSLPECPYNLYEFPFNDLDDVIEFIEKHDVWRDPVTERIYSCINMENE